MLSPKDRLNKVLKREEVDRPPCICPGGMMNMVVKEASDEGDAKLPEAHSDGNLMADLAININEKGCFENYGVPFCMTVEVEGLGAKVDMGSDIFEPRVIEYPIDSVSNWRDISKIDFEKGRVKVVTDAIKILKDKNTNVPIVGNLTGPISVASSMIEPVSFYKALRKQNEESHKFLDFVSDQLILFAEKQIESGADFIVMSDPSGTGEILGPKLFEEFTVKYVNKIIDSLKSKGIPIAVHICGQMKSVYSQVSKINSDVMSFDSIVSINESRKYLGDKLLMGNVSTYVLEYGDPDKVSDITDKCIRDGADIIAPACGLGMRSPIENIRAMMKSVDKESKI